MTFNHSSHVDQAKPDCTTCHPKTFGILGSKGGTRSVMKHKNFENGQQCGHLPQREAAPSPLADDCTICHGTRAGWRR